MEPARCWMLRCASVADGVPQFAYLFTVPFPQGARRQCR